MGFRGLCIGVSGRFSALDEISVLPHPGGLFYHLHVDVLACQ